MIYKILIIFLFFASCIQKHEDNNPNNTQEIHAFLDNWHIKASMANTDYFNDIAEQGIYIGTAKEEVWTKKEFVAFARPFFDKGKAWDFKAYDRNIYINENENIAWFNEKLETWMGICRGSGVLQNTGNGWKIYQYTLSVAVPNEKIESVISVIASEKKTIKPTSDYKTILNSP